jgi:hypothetical protein
MIALAAFDFYSFGVRRLSGVRQQHPDCWQALPFELWTIGGPPSGLVMATACTS